MTKTLNIFAAAALFSSVAIGGAFAAESYEPGDGDYFNGTTPPAVNETGAATQTDKMIVVPKVDGAATTGSIKTDDKDDGVNGKNEAGDMEYYDGAVAPSGK